MFPLPSPYVKLIRRLAATSVVALVATAPAHGAYRVTAFDNSPGFDKIMAADYTAAQHEIERAAQSYQRYARHANRCVTLLKSADVDAALASCERALDVAPVDLASSLVPLYHRRAEVLTHLYSNRGVVKAVNGDYYGARADFERALSLDPENVNAKANLEQIAASEVAQRAE